MNKSYVRSCKVCGSILIKKDGKMRGRQRYKCKSCGHVFQNKSRKKKDSSSTLWDKYSFGKQTYTQLSEEFRISVKTVQKILDSYEFITPQIQPRKIVLLMDTTYFWDLWVMAFKDSESKKIINFKLVRNENNRSYREWIRELQNQWWEIQAIVCDGRRGLLWGFEDIPTQMCHFHQAAILRRYITKKPILQANKDLKELWALLTITDRETFEYELEKYYESYKDFLKEKKTNGKWKQEYVHKRTRSAYFSLKRNLKFLFCSYDHIWVIDIPNTTNALEWVFGHLKGKVSLHRGLKRERKIKLILSLLHWKT